jgi:hypothetical protein
MRKPMHIRKWRYEVRIEVDKTSQGRIVRVATTKKN